MGSFAPAFGADTTRRRVAPSRGLWISLLWATAALGVVLAVLIPNLVQKTKRLRAKQAMSDLRTIATAVEAYAVENGRLPSLPHLVSIGGTHFDPRNANDWKAPAAWPVKVGQRVDSLEGMLSPRYIQRLPVRDGWGHPYLYATTSDRRHYAIVSTGPDGKVASVHKSVWSSEFDRDLVYADGTFFEWLEGT